MDGKKILPEEKFDKLVNPERHIPKFITEFTHIDDARIKREKAKTIDVVLEQFFDFAGDRILVAQNGIRFDIKFIQHNVQRIGLPQTNFLSIDTLWLSKKIFAEPGLKHNLDAIMERCGVKLDDSIMRHDALGDVIYTARCFAKMMKMLEELGKDKLMMEI